MDLTTIIIPHSCYFVHVIMTTIAVLEIHYIAPVLFTLLCYIIVLYQPVLLGILH